MPLIDRVSRPETGESPATVDQPTTRDALHFAHFTIHVYCTLLTYIYLFAGGSVRHLNSNRNLNLNQIAYTDCFH